MPLLDLVVTFCAFILACFIASMLMPEGSVKRTAVFAFGVLSMVLWLQGLFSLDIPSVQPSLPASLFEAASGLPDDASAFSVCERLLSDRASAAAGCAASVKLNGQGQIISLRLEPCAEAAALNAAATVGADPALITYAER